MHYYKFNIGDYAAHTRHLSLMEDLAYRRMLDMSYTTEVPLPLDVKKIARAIIMREHITEIEQVLEDFYTKTDDGWIQKRVVKELVLCNAKADKARENGKKGGRPKNPVGLGENPVGLGENPVGLGENPVGLGEKPDPNPEITQPVYTLHKTHYPVHITHNLKHNTQKLLHSLLADKPDTLNKFDVNLIFDFWKETLNHPRAKLDSKRKQIIIKAFKLKFTEDELKAAIVGCSLTPHNMGINERNTKYDELRVIFGDASQIERFIRNSTNPPKAGNNGIYSSNHKITQYERNMQAIRDSEHGQDEVPTMVIEGTAVTSPGFNE
jgi:uncharacterized protein YdaU (DUF1376 family)